MMDKATAKQINGELEAAVSAVLAAHGFERQRLSMRYSENEFKVTFEATRAGVDRRAENFARYAFTYRLPSDGLGKLFLLSGEVFEITGIEPKNRRYPLIARKHSDGKSYKLPVTEALLAQLRDPAPELAR